MHEGFVAFEDGLGVAVRNCPEAKRRVARAEGIHEPLIVYAREVVKIFTGDHKGGQISGVDGEENNCECRPDVGHKS